MLSIVSYGASDSENEISDEDEPAALEVYDVLTRTASTIRLPEPSIQKAFIAEEDDEFLHKKEVPKIAPPPIKAKVKIMIPRLSDFQDDEDDIKIPKIHPANRKTGLLSMLPKPSLSFAPAPKPVTSNDTNKIITEKTQKSQASTAEAPKKVGLIPYALMSHNPQSSESKKSLKKKEPDSDDDEDVPVGSFFTFDSKDEELPKVSEDEVKALVAKETARMEQRKRQQEETESPDLSEEDQIDSYKHQKEAIDEEAMKALLGGNKAKRSKLDNIQFIELSAADVMPNREEWLRKSLAGETSYQPTGNILEKVSHLNRHNLQFIHGFISAFQGPSALSKRKHQISYLSMRAENNEAELEAMWAANRSTKREGQNKYGF